VILFSISDKDVGKPCTMRACAPVVDAVVFAGVDGAGDGVGAGYWVLGTWCWYFAMILTWDFFLNRREALSFAQSTAEVF
jgi:hypothetical protein